MPSGFWKSEEGLKAYSDIGVGYPETVMDPLYDEFKKMTKNSPHNQKAKETITSITRVLADDGNEYLMYDCNEVAYDNLGNEREFFRGDLGKYAIPIPRRELRMGPDMTQKEVVAEVIRHDTGYSLPFTSGNVQKLHKNANDKKQRGATHYLVQRSTANPHKVTNYEAFEKGDFAELFKFGMTLDQWKEEQKALMELKKVAEQATNPQEQEQAAKSLASAGETAAAPVVSQPQPQPSEPAAEEEKEKEKRGSSSKPPKWR